MVVYVYIDIYIYIYVYSPRDAIDSRLSPSGPLPV